MFSSQIWWHIPAIPVFGRLRQEDHELGDSEEYIARTYLKRKKLHIP
jgi:hypothetical protein